nr:metallophosphoesterase family protein [Phytoactinopolyspora alkaliphila]
MRSVAILSDIHGALPALEAVLAEPDVQAADRLVLTGDIAAGPLPVQTLDLLVSLGEWVTWVRGNADRELVDVARGERSEHEVSTWAGRQLRPDQVDLLDRLPHPVTLDISGFGPVLFCHGTPRDDEEVVLVDSALSRWADVFAGLDPAVRTVVCGHTHMPFQRMVDRRLVVNAGSVGMPYGRPGPHWALLRDGVVQLRRTEVDLERIAVQTVELSHFSGVEMWVDHYTRSAASDAEALRVFAPRDGREDSQES